MKWYKETGGLSLINTSFNVRGEPIVCSPEDAYKCFMGTNLDILVCEDFILYKNEQDTNLLNEYNEVIFVTNVMYDIGIKLLLFGQSKNC